MTTEEVRQAIETAIRGDSRFRARGTCQACGRDQALRTTRKLAIVLHGYERPGHGYIKGQCSGVDELPSELSCEATKRWRDHLVNVVIPQLEDRLARKSAGEPIEHFIDIAMGMKHASPYLTDRLRQDFKNVPKSHRLIEGEAPPPVVVAYLETVEHMKIAPPYQYEGLRAQYLRDLQTDIKEARAAARQLDQRVTDWVYAPGKLIPAEPVRPTSPGQLVRSWLADREMLAHLRSLPAPTGTRIRSQPGASFHDWMHSFPRTLAWTNMRTGAWTPSYYQVVLDAYAQATGTNPGAQIRTSEKTQARVTERTAKLSEKEQKAKARREQMIGNLDKSARQVVALLQQPALAKVLWESNVILTGNPLPTYDKLWYAAQAPRDPTVQSIWISYPLKLKSGMSVGELLDSWFRRPDPCLAQVLASGTGTIEVLQQPPFDRSSYEDLSAARQNLDALAKELKAQAKAAGLKVK